VAIPYAAFFETSYGVELIFDATHNARQNLGNGAMIAPLAAHLSGLKRA